MALARNFKASTSTPNQIALNWLAPIGFNEESDELVVTRTSTHFPMEIFNEDFPNRATDSRPVELYRGRSIVGTIVANISVSGNTLTDTGAAFPTAPSLAGRRLRDENSKVFKILSNTATTITCDGAPYAGKYEVMPDFPEDIRPQENYEFDGRTEVGVGFIKNLVVVVNGSLTVKQFEPDELANLVFKDGGGNKYFVKSNTADTVFLFENVTPTSGVGMSMLPSFFESEPTPYIDNFNTDVEAANRLGTGLLDNRFYYYTVFTIPVGANVAQAEFANFDSGVSTQSYAISAMDRQFGNILYNNMWSSLDRELDSTEDLQDVMQVFGNFFNELHALVDTYRLQDTDKVLVTAVLPLSEQYGLPSVGYTIGADTLRRIGKDMTQAWKLKGSKEGIALFIKIITTWDVTNGTADFSSAIQDFLPNVSALRFFDPNLGSLNTRITKTDPFVAGGRFAKSLPGIVIPGFFTFREFVITLPNVALFIGTSEGFTVAAGTTTMVDTTQNFGATDSLVGNFLIPNSEEVNDIFQIVSNTNTSITVRGIINNRVPGGSYAILSPLNTNRFVILNKLLPVYIPFGTRAGFRFIIV
jgi:hypothetical protein